MAVCTFLINDATIRLLAGVEDTCVHWVCADASQVGRGADTAINGLLLACYLMLG